MGPFLQMQQIMCNHCNGNGVQIKQNVNCECINYKITQEKMVELDIERGVINGKQYIIEGWGETGLKRNEVNGDFVITINIESDTDFKRDGLDLYYDCRISLKESIIGGEIIIPHFDGPITMSLRGFGIINPKKTYTILKRGLVNSNECGDLHLRFYIDYPVLNLNDSEINQLKILFEKMELGKII
jgi:DnaJ-class molecular chaperone